MINEIKKIFCKHTWRETYSGEYYFQYVCIKCGKDDWTTNFNKQTWEVQRKLKGDTFE